MTLATANVGQKRKMIPHHNEIMSKTHQRPEWDEIVGYHAPVSSVIMCREPLGIRVTTTLVLRNMEDVSNFTAMINNKDYSLYSKSRSVARLKFLKSYNADSMYASSFGVIWHDGELRPLVSVTRTIEDGFSLDDKYYKRAVTLGDPKVDL